MPHPSLIALALSGASGAPYFLRLLERLRIRDDVALHIIPSEGGRRVLLDECGIHWRDLDFSGCQLHTFKNIGASLASGSFRLNALVVVPASMHTISAMAVGLADNLILRAAAVQLKERRRLIVVPRETPISAIHLRAMATLAEAGALVLPAMPAFYHAPKTIQDIVDSVVDRIIDHLNISDPDIKRWDPSAGGR